jgi:hypothetical protein
MPTEQELQRAVDVSKAVQKKRYEAKSRAWKIYVEARARYRRRRQITQARVLRLKKFRQPKGPGKAVAWALAQVGTVEQPPFSNAGGKISQWELATLGSTGWPWCQAFVNAALVKGGGEQLKSAYTPQVVQWAREGKHGLRLVTSPQPGDFVYFKFPGVSSAFCDHVGLWVGDGKTVEGNTSSGSAGSQNNGGGVYLRVRPRSQMVAFVRPTYR